MTSPPPQRHPKEEEEVKRERSRSPLQRPRQGAIRKAVFNDEIGGELVKEIPMRARSPEDPAPKKKQGPAAKARTEVPRLPGESRAAWKNRVFDHLKGRKQGA